MTQIKSIKGKKEQSDKEARDYFASTLENIAKTIRAGTIQPYALCVQMPQDNGSVFLFDDCLNGVHAFQLIGALEFHKHLLVERSARGR